MKKHIGLAVGIIIALIGAVILTQTLNVNAVANYTNVATETDFATALADPDPIVNITITSDITITSTITIPSGKTVNLSSDTGSRILLRGTNMTGSGTASTTGLLFYVLGGATFNFSNIIIDGGAVTDSNGVATSGIKAMSPLIYNGGVMMMNNGAILRNNNNQTSGGANGAANLNGGAIINAGNLTINGGEIYDNTARMAAVDNLGAMTMNNGSIYHNHGYNGGGVCNAATFVFTMAGGEIYENYADTLVYNGVSAGAYGFGGGVMNMGGKFYLQGGSIRDNYAHSQGGGINDNSAGTNTFVMTGGTVTGNSAPGNGGGIMIAGQGDISGGLVANNTSGNIGGGIYVAGGRTLTVSGDAIIQDNHANNGGGIGISASGAFVNISGAVQIFNNTAVLDGGGIWTPYQYLANINVANTVTFANNSAHAAYLINPVDIPTYQAHVLTTAFTVPFDQPAINWGYNNYDISYTGGQLVYIVSFDSKGGSVVNPQAVLPNDLAVEPTPPTRAGYKFAGWFTDDGTFANSYDFNTAVTGNVTLYAKWDALCQWNSLLLESDAKCVEPKVLPPTLPIVPAVPNTGCRS